MTLSSCWTKRAQALVLVLGGLSVSTSAWGAPDVQSLKEAQLPAGKLPAWETKAEQSSGPKPRVPHSWQGPTVLHPPAAGYRVPAEFDPMAAFLVSREDWTTDEIDMLVDMLKQGTAAKGAGAIAVTTDSVSSLEGYLLGQGVDLSRIHVLQPTGGLNAKWARDFGPISLYEGGEFGHLAFGDLHYYNKRAKDDAVVAFLAGELGLNRYGLEGSDHEPPDDVKLYMEGGNYQTDGKGTCILSNDIPADNTKANNESADTLAEVEQILGQYLGCKKFVWLTPPPNTGTGHVDMYTKLLTATDMLVIDFPKQTTQDKEASEVIEQNVAILQAATNIDGDPFVIHRVTIPSLTSAWVYRTYTNSLILNKVVMVPIYGRVTDQPALEAYQAILGPTYTVVGIDASSIVSQGGAVHCTTMQIASACGDGVVEELLFEECEGKELGGKTCKSLGLPEGELKCDPVTCVIDTKGCVGLPEPAPEPKPEPVPEPLPEASPEASQEAAIVHADGAVDAMSESARAQDAPVEASEPLVARESEVEGGSCGCRAGSPRAGAAPWAAVAAALAWGLSRKRRRLCKARS